MNEDVAINLSAFKSLHCNMNLPVSFTKNLPFIPFNYYTKGKVNLGTKEILFRFLRGSFSPAHSARY